MINDWYQAILDVEAPPEHTKDLAIKVTSALAYEKIITIHKPNQILTHISGKFAPGSGFQDASGINAGPYQEMNIGGMDVYTDAWVNEYGIAGLDSALCPVCNKNFTIETFDQLAIIKESFALASAGFLSEKGQPHVTCPSCQTTSHATQWQTQPHLGFCNLAFIFWNWPPFDNWRINIPDLISQTLQHKIIVTYGHL